MIIKRKTFQKMLANEILEDLALFGFNYKIKAYFNKDQEPIDYDVFDNFSDEEMNAISSEKNYNIEILEESADEKEYECEMLAIKFLAKLISYIDEISFQAAMLKAIRITLGLSLRTFSEKIKISNPNVSMYENGKKTFSKRTISKICETFNLKEEIFEDDTPFDQMGYEKRIIS